jgi:glycosyltransferase involved in cell wall biosynthesis
MSTVTVIIPTYNCGHFIAEAMDSVLGQTQVPDQIIIVDDGSTDDTDQVVRRYTDSRIEYKKQPNAGVSAARNVGLDGARCEFVTFLDADDRWRPRFVARMHDLMAADPTAVCAFANFVRFEHETGQVLRDQFHYYPRGDAFHKIPQERAFSTLVAWGEIPAFPVVMMYRRSRLDPIRFDPTLRTCEDMDFALRAFMRGAVIFTSEVLCEVRRHDGNATRNYAGMAVHKLRVLKALASELTSTGDITAYRDRLVKAHIDAALHQTKCGDVGAGVRNYLDGLHVPNSPMRKLKGSVRMALALPHGLVTTHTH